MSGELSLIIGEKIRKRRIDLGYTQAFLSLRLSTTQNAVSNIEKGKAGLNIERLIKISEILKVDLNYFVSVNNIDQKEIRIQELEELVKRLEKRNEILENYIVKLMEEPKIIDMNNEKINVLIIDDEPQILVSFKAHYRKFYNVFTASDTDDAKKIIVENNIQVILCDYNMPKKDGILFFSEILLTNPEITRILITAHDGLQIAIEAINVGSIYRYVQKPWNLDELKIIIDQSYDFYKLKQENQSLMDRLLSNDRLIKLLEGKQ